ncbi:MAG: TonB-dependent receptor plug domain-containing protein, partial [Pseudomonadota bacterium]
MTKKIGTSGSSSKFRYLLGASAAALAIGGVSTAVAEDAVEDIVVDATNSSAIAAAAAVAAIQQDGDVADDEDRDVVVVTGSRIRRPVDTTIDVSTIGAAEFEDRAFTNPLQAIDDLPIGGFGNFSPNNQGPNTQRGDNGAFPDLLNIGTNRTLTLVDGRRFVGSTQATVFVPGNANGVQVDLSIINPALIERTEVLTVGGGPIYGADAVAGVVNIILKDDFEGLNLLAQGGITQEGDGENYRFTGLWGKNFDDGRGNLTISGEYFHAERIQADPDGGDRPLDRGISPITNPNSAGPEQIFIANSTNPLQPAGGLVSFENALTGSVDAPIFPSASCTGATGTLATFCAGSGGLSPFAFAQANPGIDPNLFIGTFAPANSVPFIPNPDGATNTFLPNLAVPLTFDSSGNLVPVDFGNIAPPNPAAINETIGGSGFRISDNRNIQSGTERIVANGMFKYELTDNMTFKTNLLYSRVESDAIGQTGSGFNWMGGSSTAGSRATPIYIDQNPLLSASALATLNQLEADGAVLPTLNGERVIYINRDQGDIISRGGPNNTGVISGDELTTWRSASELSGEFEALNRDFYWDVSFV